MTTDNQPARRGNPRLVIIVLILVFSAPLLSSLLLLNYPELVNLRGASHGDLYDPFVQLPDVALNDPRAGGTVNDSLHGQWTLLYISSGACGETCRHKLYSMRQIRLAVGRYARHLRRVWMTDIDDRGQLQRHLREFEGTLVLPMDPADPPLPLEAFAMPPVSEPLASDSIYVVDPRGQLVLRYRPGTDPEGIISDLERLLKSSSIS